MTGTQGELFGAQPAPEMCLEVLELMASMANQLGPTECNGLDAMATWLMPAIGDKSKVAEKARLGLSAIRDRIVLGDCLTSSFIDSVSPLWLSRTAVPKDGDLLLHKDTYWDGLGVFYKGNVWRWHGRGEGRKWGPVPEGNFDILGSWGCLVD